jgi:hypothetical protein
VLKKVSCLSCRPLVGGLAPALRLLGECDRTPVKQGTSRAAGRGFTLLQLLLVAALLFFGALLWAKGRDPFRRVRFAAKAPGQGKVECLAVVPKGSLKSNRPSSDYGPARA